MSHELRTPLNAVIGFSEMIARQNFGPVGSPRYMEYAKHINDSGTHLLRIISDILDLAKIEASQIELEENIIDLSRLFSACKTIVATRAAQGEVTVTTSRTLGLPHLKGDELRVKQIVLNLLGNAVKFSPRGGTVWLSALVTENRGLAIVIADEGCGMTEGELTLALQPFRQVNSSIAKRAEGTGLGLPLAQRLAEIHGGTLEIQTAPSRGTTVTVRFPPQRICSDPETSAAAE